jgi:DNA-binding CsgD family transcriptional regulator
MKHLKTTGIFFGTIFCIAGVINIFLVLSKPNATVAAVIGNAQTIEIFLLSAILFASGFNRFLSWIQPIIFLLVTPLPFQTTHESFYGLGFFVIAIILLFRLDFFQKNRLVKFILSLAYLYGCELYAALKQGRNLYFAATPIFAITVFIVFLYLVFQEKLAVYLKEPKQRLSLKERGLSDTERSYVLAVAAGKNTKELSIEFSVSESTIRNSLSRAYRKLGIENRTGIAALAEKYELVG